VSAIVTSDATVAALDGEICDSDPAACLVKWRLIDWSSTMGRQCARSGAKKIRRRVDASQGAAGIVRETGRVVKKFPTVFIVDNRSAVSKSLEEIIKKRGFPVQCFNSAAEFIAEQEPNQVGCVLVDPMAAADGDAVLRWLHESGSLFSIVLISGLVDSSSQAAKQDPLAPIVEKPHQVAALLTMVGDGLAGSISRKVIRERTRG
jgi:CheY-like chemotaxis protein